MSEVQDLITPIRDLGLSTYTCNMLQRNGILTVGDLAKWSRNDLLGIEQFGKVSYRNLMTRLYIIFQRPGRTFLRQDLSDASELDRQLTVAKYVCPTLSSTGGIVKFRGADGALHDDLSLEETTLVYRVTNCLHRAGYHSLRPLMDAQIDDLKSVKTFGAWTFNVLMTYLLSICVVVPES